MVFCGELWGKVGILRSFLYFSAYDAYFMLSYAFLCLFGLWGDYLYSILLYSCSYIVVVLLLLYLLYLLYLLLVLLLLYILYSGIIFFVFISHSFTAFIRFGA